MNLKYRVYSVSSEAPDFPASNLQQQCGAWESEPNCPYPQEITVQFYIPISTRNMKVMFHQYKIPKLMEVFVKCGKHEKYRKLGLVQPNDNSQSDYLQKQIKTVFFEFPCTFVKLVLHQNYRNDMNLFDQIALLSLTFEGEFMPSANLKNLEANVLDWLDTSSDEEPSYSSQQKINSELSIVHNEHKPAPNVTFASNMFPQTFSRLEQLKKEAVDRQQFQKAAYIKNSILNFQEQEKQIQKLEQLKRISLQEQDYDRCHKLKQEISRKKEMMTYQIKEFQSQIVSNEQVLAMSRASQIQQSRANFNTQRDNRPQIEQTAQKTPNTNRSAQPSNVFEEYESQVVPALRKKKNQGEDSSYVSVAKGNQSLMDGLRSPKAEQYEQADESVEIRGYDLNRILAELPQLQPLDFKTQKRYEPFFDYIPADLWRMVLSARYQKNWRITSYALDHILGLEVSEGKHLIANMQFVAITIVDKHTMNIKKSLQLLQKLVNLPDKDIWCDPNHPKYFVDGLLSTLIQLMNDTKEQFRKLAVQVYKNLPQFSLFHLETAIKMITKTSPVGYSKNKRKSNPRLQQAKLAVVEYYLSTFADVVHHLNEIIKWLAECANDASSEVKMAATQLLLQIGRMDKELYSRVKEELNKQSSQSWEVYEGQYNLLMAEIENSKVMISSKAAEKAPASEQSLDIYKKQTMRSKNKNSSRVISSSNNESLFVSPNKKDSEDVELAYSRESISNQEQSHSWFANNDHNDIRVMEPEEAELEGICDFCYEKYDEPQDQHLINNCCVVIPCQFCGSVIYLREMTTHFLNECTKSEHQQCPRCMLAFEFDEINEHVARKICRKAKTHMERCQFCEEDIEPEDVSWVDHSKKCDKIVRPGRRTERSQGY